ncbi:MAG: hypothetical protein QXM96_00370 [Candidatus Woesearchaeota archaeon]
MTFLDNIIEDLEFIGDKLGNLLNKSPKFIYSGLLTLALIFSAGFGVQRLVYNYLQEKDKNRVYQVAETIPPVINELSSAVPLSIQIGNLSARADQIYILVLGNQENVNLDYNDTLKLFLTGFKEHPETARNVILLYQNPDFQEALSLISEGSNLINKSFSQTHMDTTTSYQEEECGYKHNPKTNQSEYSCEMKVKEKCENRTFYLTKNQEQIDQGFERIKQGLEKIVFGQHFSQMAFSQIDPNFPNANNAIILIYNSAGSSHQEVTRNLEYYQNLISGYPDFYIVQDPSCSIFYYPWQPESISDGLVDHINNITGLNQIPEILNKFLDVSNEYSKRLKNADSREEIGGILGDYSIELHRILNLPGSGHLFQNEIIAISYGVGILTILAIIAGAYLFYINFFDSKFLNQ